MISWPSAYYFTNKLAEIFSYQITLNGWIFIGATFVSLVNAVATISVQAIHAALANPVDSLKNV